MAEPLADLKCRRCKAMASDGFLIHFCSACNYHQCATCWPLNFAHEDDILGPNGLAHEKIDPRLVASLKQCMEAPKDEIKAHFEDRETAWFGVWTDPDNGEYLFQDQGTYASIMARSSLDSRQQRFPKIVSFIGETGAGKSSLIKLLIDLQHGSLSDPENFSRPVVGSATDQRPTSADVHLFSDPMTFNTTKPILYADSEGMDGGTIPPIADRAFAEAEKTGSAKRWAYSIRRRLILWIKNDKTDDHGNADKEKKHRGSNRSLVQRAIPPRTRGEGNKAERSDKHKQSETPEEERRRRRDYAVQEMYPRILYAFSDVIVYVLVNPKKIEVVAEKLLAWAQANAEGSINLPTKPHAIIVWNKVEANTDSAAWDPVRSTHELLNFNIVESKAFRKYCKPGIINMKQLLNHYYSEVTVIRMPEKNNFDLLDRQRSSLYDTIYKECDNSHLVKLQAQMLADADDLQLYLQSAFDHFSESLDRPFDFIAASVKNCPISHDLSGHVVCLADLVAHEIRAGTTNTVFDEITDFVASCIRLDAARKHLLGGPKRWFDFTQSNRPGTKRKKPGRNARTDTAKGTTSASNFSYSELCDNAITRYQNLYAPCEHTEQRKFHDRPLNCKLKQQSHEAEHRYAGHMRTAPGRFETSYVKGEYNWTAQLSERLISMDEGFPSTSLTWSSKSDDLLKTSRRRAFTQHLKELRKFRDNLYGKPGKKPVGTHTTCLCCLHHVPEFKMPCCDQLICLACAYDIGEADGRGQLVTRQCPYHQEQDMDDTVLTQLKPSSAGLRVLTLDGGGMRGIVELLVLEHIEAELGGLLQIQQFFDLIVGTSTGGIIALGLGVKEWSVKECKGKFCDLVNTAFTPRTKLGFHYLTMANMIKQRSQYRTKPLESALKEAFGDKQRLFGDVRGVTRFNNKVAVMSASATGSRGKVLANYGRSERSLTDLQGLPFVPIIDRPRTLEHELYIWEAARCTSAAPGFFKPYLLTRRYGLHYEYIDGAVLFNNPVLAAYREARIAFEDGSSKVIDVLLSLGTGRDENLASSGTLLQNTALPFERDPDLQTRGPLRTLFMLAKNQVALNLRTDAIWDGFSRDLSALSNWQMKRCRRINPWLGRAPPALDAVKEFDETVKLTEQALATKDMKGIVTETAKELVASCFYFKQIDRGWDEKSDSFICKGVICCRFENRDVSGEGGQELVDLGNFIKKHASGVAYFLVSPENKRTTDHITQTSAIPVGGMIDKGAFDTPAIEIFLYGANMDGGEPVMSSIFIAFSGLDRGKESTYLHISGFPRVLFNDKTVQDDSSSQESEPAATAGAEKS